MVLGGNKTCNINSLPASESLGIASDITVGFVPRDNQTEEAMARCCSPNTVNLVDDCVLWCELPDQLAADQIAFNTCLRQTWNESGISGIHKASTAAVTSPNLGGLGMLILIVGFLCHAI
ncbi:hypothetical protein GGS26DRAFT_313090 [Hypomontagnella submonticulosa]|nr:hypothetical protein GGS26DRAFT_313090 [Hypomontagnella submonticulosa]